MNNASDSFPLIDAAMEAAAAEAQPPPAAELHASVPPPSFIPLPADFASRPPPGPVDLSYPLAAPARPAAPPPASPPTAELPYRPLPAPAESPPAPCGTLAALLNGVAQSASRPSWPAPMPQAGLLPAGMVTLPLAEVMRLVGGTMPDPASPFAAFRIAGGPSGAR
ncbi:hypothetical protein JMJ56_18145 [Belnapia sp. T18]|uniref:Uncharacterized protein n=1 Tax=Belnapia arida TaxID=2804533 RepID=A0ABS1U727_9PROT|nr:hypothetical protein [Belnapia arida]MBL6079945.1 hypothetical protein [Belnapia arida]